MNKARERLSRGDVGLPRWATSAEAAAYLRVTPRCLRQWAAAGKITAYRSGTRFLRYDLAELDRFLTGGAA
ncbi:MAG TPA: helix-turn-helix domain-containing protein [Mycobacterium sp.]|nr:helix-turn-helix domain-containing protein [Mycobacterium sp.]